MKTNGVTRREALKVMGAFGAAALNPTQLCPADAFQDKTEQNKDPNFIIILFDTFSARHMSLYGYERKTTPNIERFAKSSTTFHRHYSASNFTQPSTASILTGVYPWSHRSLDFFESLLDEYESTNIFSCLRPEYQTIAYTHNLHALNILEQFRDDVELLKPIEDLVLLRTNKLEHRFKQDKVIGEYAAKRWLEDDFSPAHSLFINPLFSVASSIVAPSVVNHRYRYSYPVGVSELEGYYFKLEDAIDWILRATNSAQPPFLGYFHLLPPHDPYKPRRPFYNMFANDGYRLPLKPEHFFSECKTEEELQLLAQRYDEYIADVDSEFGRLVDNLDAQGILDNTYLILTSDHGQLFERGMHAHNVPVLYESLIHTPLVIRAPGQTQELHVQSPTSAVDLVPTILNRAGYEVDEFLEGKPLPSLGGKDDPARTIFSMHARRNTKLAPLTTVTLAAIQWPFKLIRSLGYDGLEDFDELFDLEKDPDELTNIVGQRPDVVSMLGEELRKSQTQAEAKSLGFLEME